MAMQSITLSASAAGARQPDARHITSTLARRQELLRSLHPQPAPESALGLWARGEKPSSKDFRKTVQFCWEAKPRRLDLVRAVQDDHPDFRSELSPSIDLLAEIVHHRIDCDCVVKLSGANFREVAAELRKPGCEIRSLELEVPNGTRNVDTPEVLAALEGSRVTSLKLTGVQFACAPVVLPTQLESLTICTEVPAYEAQKCAQIVAQPCCRNLTLDGEMGMWIAGINTAGRLCHVDMLDLSRVAIGTTKATPATILARLLSGTHRISELRLRTPYEKLFTSPAVMNALKLNTKMLTIRVLDKSGQEVELPEIVRLSLDRNRRMAGAGVAAAAAVHYGRGLEGDVLSAYGNWVEQSGSIKHHSDYAGLIQSGALVFNTEPDERGQPLRDADGTLIRASSLQKARERRAVVFAAHGPRLNAAFEAEKQRQFVAACAEIQEYAGKNQIDMPTVMTLVTARCENLSAEQFATIKQIVLEAIAKQLDADFAPMIRDDVADDTE